MKNGLSYCILCLTVLCHAQDEQASRFWINASLLAFLPQEKSVVLTNRPTDLFTTADVTLQPPLKPHFRWDVGSRVAWGYHFSDQKWDMSISWMRFGAHLKQQVTTHGDIGLGVFPIWSLADDILPFDWVSHANMQWKLKLNILDIEWGRTFWQCNQFVLRLPLGVRAACIHQHFNVGYGGGIFANGLNLAALDSTFGCDRINMKNNFWGIGPRLAVEPQLSLGKGFRLYATAAGTAACGIFHLAQKEVYLKTLRYQRNCCPVKIRWIVDATGGILWKRKFCDDQYALTCAFGWEYHLFLKQLELKGDRFGLVSCDRNLVLNGFAFTVNFDF